MKILLASVAVPGHLNPLLSVARILQKHNHEVVVQTGTALKPIVEASGLPFIPFLPEADMGALDYLAKYPQRNQLAPGSIEMKLFDWENFLMKLLPSQFEGLEAALRDFPADVVVADCLLFGTVPFLLSRRKKLPAFIHLGISVVDPGSGNMPPRLGVSPEEERAIRAEEERLLLNPEREAFDKVLMELGCDPLPCPAWECMSSLPDYYLQAGIEGFHYSGDKPISPAVRFIGALPLPPSHHTLPDWWNELDKKKRLVLLTQGTIANMDFGQLIGPALTGLAEEEDLIVLVTTGGRPVESIPVEIPENVRVANFLPYEQILPHVDLLITNGGYGTVNLALAHGIPIISAGLTEDKEEVSAQVQWSGVGIDLRSNQPSPQAVRTAVRKVFDTPTYRDRARELAREFASHNTEEEVLEYIESSVKLAVEA